MVRVRPRIYFPNFWLRLKLYPSPEQLAADPHVAAGKMREDGTFVTDTIILETRSKNLTKIDLRLFLRRAYGLDIKEIRTVNALGKRKFLWIEDIKKRVERKQPDVKRIYVKLSSEVVLPFSPLGVAEILKPKESPPT